MNLIANSLHLICLWHCVGGLNLAVWRQIVGCTCLQCEEDCKVCDVSGKMLAFCCIANQSTYNVQCCPKPFRCCEIQEHLLCVYTKSGCCSEEVPCEVALFGVHCKDGRDLVKTYEEQHPEEFIGGEPQVQPEIQATVVEGVVVSTTKGGAPSGSDTMIRE